MEFRSANSIRQEKDSAKKHRKSGGSKVSLHASNSPHNILQNHFGNSAIARLLKSGRLKTSEPLSPEERAAGHQAKIAVNRSTLPTEQSAENIKPIIKPELNQTARSQYTTILGRSQPLETSIRTDFEARLGYDLSTVRIHTDETANSAAKTLGAQAFTIKNNIAFAKQQYQPDSARGRALLAHELTHVVQRYEDKAAKLPDVQLKREPDVVHRGYYSFYLTTGNEHEFAVQFHYSGSGDSVTIKVAHQPSLTMRQGTITLPEGATFDPIATVDGETIALFDLDNDGEEDVAVQTVVDEYEQEFLTADTTPFSPSVEAFSIRDVYVVATWSGGSLSFRVMGRAPERAIAPPVWRMMSHPHPNIGMVWLNTHTGSYVIPPTGGYSLDTRGREGPPPFFSQAGTLEEITSTYEPEAPGGEAVNDPFAVQGPTQEGELTLAHEQLRSMEALEHGEVPTWGASDVAWWKTLGGQQFLYDYKDRWVRGYRNAIRAAADTYDIPRVLLAGVAWIEVGGDPDWIDTVAYWVRGSEGELTTSIAPMSLQVRRAAEELGYNPALMTDDQRDAVLESLQDPQQAIFIAARHLASLRDVDFRGKGAADLTAEEVAVIATRYNRGPDIPLAQIRLNLDYGIAILRRSERLMGLLEEE